MTDKQCKGCKETKPTSEFGIDNGRQDGLLATCKPCTREYYRARRAARKDGAPFKPRAKRKLVNEPAN